MNDAMRRLEDLVIYELHVGSLGFGTGRIGTFEDVVGFLDLVGIKLLHPLLGGGDGLIRSVLVQLDLGTGAHVVLRLLEQLDQLRHRLAVDLLRI